MIDKIYIQFDTPIRPKEESGVLKQSIQNLTINVISKFIPKANPDFDDKIKNVVHWIVECKIETGIPNREIGIDQAGNILMIMPFRSNSGYWTDNNLLLNDFKEHFSVSEISHNEFEEKWKSFESVKK